MELPSFAVWENVCLGQWVVPRHRDSRLASSENRSRTYVHLGTSRKFTQVCVQVCSRKRPAREIAGKLFEEDIKNNLADEGMDQLLGVPVAEKANT